MKRIAHFAGWLILFALLTPLAYAIWASFSPGELLALPGKHWSLRWYGEFATSPRWRSALFNSLEIAALSALLSTLTGVSLALALARGRFPGRRLLAGAVLVPLFVPPVVLGMGLLPLVHVLGVVGEPETLAVAHSLGSLPVVTLIVRAALEDVPADLEAAARGLGASPLRAFARVTWPLVRPAAFAGAAISFVLSLNEFILAQFLGTPESETLPRVVWPMLRDTLSPLAAVASAVTTVVTLVMAFTGWRILGRLVGGGQEGNSL